MQAWIDGDIDDESRDELRRVLQSEQDADLSDRMAGPLEFGTAGLRGILGAGPNRMNRAVVVRTTAGLAQYLLATVPDAKLRGVVVGYDARRMSRQFAQEAACVLAAFGMTTYLATGLISTPQTAFATTELGAAAGIMVTASHNPPEYNGYKVYWHNGAQIIPPHDLGIAKAIDAIGAAKSVSRLSLNEARRSGLLVDIPSAMRELYLRRVAELSIHSEGRSGLRIVYTPLHGVGNSITRAALEQAGFDDVASVPEQAAPDGEFPTVRFPNPEEEGALNLAIALAKDKHAHLVLANDPDVDRLAVAVPARDGQGYVQLTGNQIGIILGHYLLADHPRPKPDRLVVTTIVSSPLLREVANALGVRSELVLTGFKWIANKALALEAKTGHGFVFGYEEALGYTVGTVVRDKDGISAAAIFAELTAYHRHHGRTVLDELERIYRRYGLYISSQKSVVQQGLEGARLIAQTMASLRANPPCSIGEYEVVAITDYQLGCRSVRGSATETIDLPASNVLSFELSGGSRVAARPSGTEPKIKFYFDVREPIEQSESYAAAEHRANLKLKALEQAFLNLAKPDPSA